MKKTLFTLAIIALLLTSFAIESSAQKRPPKWVSDKGFWVVQSNTRQPKQSTIYFYNSARELVYKENITGIKLKADCKEVRLRLKEVLENAVTAWEKQPQLRENEMMVAAALKR